MGEYICHLYHRQEGNISNIQKALDREEKEQQYRRMHKRYFHIKNAMGLGTGTKGSTLLI